MFDTADIAEMIATFGESVIIDTAGDSRTVTAIFDNDHRAIDMGEGQVGTRAPMLTLATSDVEEVIDPGEVGDSGTTATVNGTVYRVTSHQPDGNGFSVLILTQEV